jgi:hypothetical protein
MFTIIRLCEFEFVLLLPNATVRGDEPEVSRLLELAGVSEELLADVFMSLEQREREKLSDNCAVLSCVDMNQQGQYYISI